MPQKNYALKKQCTGASMDADQVLRANLTRETERSLRTLSPLLLSSWSDTQGDPQESRSLCRHIPMQNLYSTAIEDFNTQTKCFTKSLLIQA